MSGKALGTSVQATHISKGRRSALSYSLLPSQVGSETRDPLMGHWLVGHFGCEEHKKCCTAAGLRQAGSLKEGRNRGKGTWMA